MIRKPRIENEHLLSLVARLPRTRAHVDRAAVFRRTQHGRDCNHLRTTPGHGDETAFPSDRTLALMVRQGEPDDEPKHEFGRFVWKLWVAALRSRPRLTDRVMDEVRQSVADGSIQDQSKFGRPSMLAPRAMSRRRRRLFTAAAGTIATIGVVLLVAIMMFPSPSVGWADVTKAIQSRKVDSWDGHVHQR